jgi:hypothetical protein
VFEDGAGERASGLRLAHRDAVQPDDRPAAVRRYRCVRQATRALAEAGRVFSVAEGVEEETREEEGKAEGQEDAVEEIHQ